MRKIAIFTGLLGTALLVANAGPSLEGYVQALNSAKSVNAEFTVNVIGGNSKAFTVQLSKPNMVRIDKENETIVADGTSILTYDKKAKTYFKRPQNETELAQLFQEDELSLFAPFFNEKSFAKLKTTDGGTKNRKGMSLNVINGTFEGGKKSASFFLDSNMIARQLEYVYPDNNSRVLIDTKSFTLSGDSLGADAFAFKAPEGARELSLDEMSVGKWFHNLDEAKKIAKATGKIIMIDFMTSWCGPCKMMAAEAFTSPEFLERAKKLVLCKLDAEVETGLASQYKVDAYPICVFIMPDGTEIHRYRGYGGVNQVLGDVDTALAAAR